jgi:hypothetical protein
MASIWWALMIAATRPGKTRLDLSAARGVVHLHALALGADQAGLAQHLEVMRQRRLRDHPVVDARERRAGL